MIGKKDKRSDIRIPIMHEKVDIVFNGEYRVYNISDVSENGMFIKLGPSDKLIPPNKDVKCTFHLPGDLGGLNVNGVVCRSNWAKKINVDKNYYPGFAVRFSPMDDNVKKIWDAFRIYLRNKQIITVSKRIIEEFFGNMKGPKR